VDYQKKEWVELYDFLKLALAWDQDKKKSQLNGTFKS